MTIGQIRGWAFGLLHLRRQDFYEMTPAEFYEALDAYVEEKEADRRHQSELTRGLGVRIFNLFSKKFIPLSEFWHMPWDSPIEQDKEVKRLQSLKGEDLQKEVDKFFERLGENQDNNGRQESKLEDQCHR